MNNPNGPGRPPLTDEEKVEFFMRHVPGIRQALRHAAINITLDEVMTELNEKRAHVFANDTALVIAQLLDPNADEPTVHIWVATGALSGVLDLQNEIFDAARSLGYTRATLLGRRGWARALKDRGWKEMGELVSMEAII